MVQAKGRPCRNFVAGGCKQGDNCQFWHIPLCTFHKAGQCKHGNDCEFLHAVPKAPNPKSDGKNSPRGTSPNPKAKAKTKAKDGKTQGGGGVATTFLTMVALSTAATLGETLGVQGVASASQSFDNGVASASQNCSMFPNVGVLAERYCLTFSDDATPACPVPSLGAKRVRFTTQARKRERHHLKFWHNLCGGTRKAKPKKRDSKRKIEKSENDHQWNAWDLHRELNPTLGRYEIDGFFRESPAPRKHSSKFSVEIKSAKDLRR